MTKWMLDVLVQQQFNAGIPAGLPDDIRADASIAHKTGEISTVAHDAGLVILPDRTAYVVAILIETNGDCAPSMQCIAALSRAAYRQVMAMREGVTGGRR